MIKRASIDGLEAENVPVSEQEVVLRETLAVDTSEATTKDEGPQLVTLDTSNVNRDLLKGMVASFTTSEFSRDPLILSKGPNACFVLARITLKAVNDLMSLRSFPGMDQIEIAARKAYTAVILSADAISA